MKKRDIWIADLTHTAQGICVPTFPLGASYVASYAKKELGKDFDIKLFKIPSQLNKALLDRSPTMLCFSNFSWNFELAYKFSYLAKQKDPNVITIFGGPNFPTDEKEKIEFLATRPAIDFYIEFEGELAFVDLIKNLSEYNFDALNFKKHRKSIINTCYINENELVTGPIERIKDINEIPSPYLSGIMDEYFELPLVPMLETNRGCPFTCTFCADGIAIKNKIHRHDPQRIKDELEYIAKRAKNVEELIITDLNFAMYKQDIVTAKMIAELQQKYNWPRLIQASAGKNMHKRIIEVASMIKGWKFKGSIQSSDPEVLKAIKRSNISTTAYIKMTNFGNRDESRKPGTEILLGLPADTKQKHYESLRFAINNDATPIYMFQSIMLPGTEMASKMHRKKYGLKTMFRTVPGCLGNYDLLDKKHSIAEIEEIIVGSNTLSKDDYLDCRVMNLIVQTFWNDSMFDEVFALLRSINVAPFDCLVYIKEHPELYSERIKKIMASFVIQTTEDLFETFEEAKKYVLSPEIIDKYIGGEMGINELLVNRSLLFNEFEDVCNLVFESAIGTLNQKNLLTPAIKDYLVELKKFISMRKMNPLTNTEVVTSTKLRYDFEEIRKANYRIDPNSLTVLKTPLQFDFFHDQDQQEHISKQLKLYANHAIGIGKLLQHTHLDMIFRRFSKSSSL